MDLIPPKEHPERPAHSGDNGGVALASPDRPAVFEGDLSGFMTADVFAVLNMLRKSGVLSARREGVEKQVFWQDGEVVFAASSTPEDSLGGFLVRHGRISAEQANSAYSQSAPGRRQGKVLVEMGLITPRQLWWAVKNQVLDIVYSLFAWHDGRFAFHEGAAIPDEKIQLQVSAANLIMEGMRRIDEWPRIRELISSHDAVPVAAMNLEKARSEINFEPREAELFQLIDGRRTVRALISESELDEFDTLASLYSFLRAGIVKFPGKPMRDSRAMPESRAGAADDAEAIRELLSGYDAMLRQLFTAMLAHLGSGEARVALNRVITTSMGGHPLVHNLKFNDEGQLDPNALLANAAEIAQERRLGAIDDGLGQLLGFCLFEISKKLSRENKDSAFAAMTRARENLEKIRGRLLATKAG